MVATQFNLYEPSSIFTQKIGLAGLNSDSTAIGLFNLPGDRDNGISFEASVQTPVAVTGDYEDGGEWNFLQLWDDDHVYNGLRSERYDQFGLDNEWPIQGRHSTYDEPLDANVETGWSTGSSTHGFVDAPQIGLRTNTDTASNNSRFMTYVMYLAPGIGSAWVPSRSLIGIYM